MRGNVRISIGNQMFTDSSYAPSDYRNCVRDICFAAFRLRVDRETPVCCCDPSRLNGTIDTLRHFEGVRCSTFSGNQKRVHHWKARFKVSSWKCYGNLNGNWLCCRWLFLFPSFLLRSARFIRLFCRTGRAECGCGCCSEFMSFFTCCLFFMI